MATLLGFDFGLRKIGVAVGQTITGTASPLQTLQPRNDKPDWAKIEALINEWCPDALIVGLPLEQDGQECEIAPRARRFSRQLEGRFRLPVYLADERYTSRIAHSMAGGRVRHSDDLDAVAAGLIIETWLTEQDRSGA